MKTLSDGIACFSAQLQVWTLICFSVNSYNEIWNHSGKRLIDHEISEQNILSTN
jgi:hypothetical protein